jgi:predicted dithiol-disulfide oxidoreductase (DUF899 family)
MTTETSPAPRVVGRAEWLLSRIDLLQKEKELTRRRDELSRLRRKLPWVRIDKRYAFDTAHGRRTLAELFDGRSQLIVKHFMLGPGWREGCVGCSFEVDHVEGALVHLQNHDVTVVAVSRAPLAEIEAFQRRMGWSIPWVSSHGSDFNYDFHVSFTADAVGKKAWYNYRLDEVPSEELSGFSVFARDGADVFHTYSAYGRGAEEVLGTYMLLDLTPKGRNETGRGNLTDWVRLHDAYDVAGAVGETGRFVAASQQAPCCAREVRT